jgi:phenylalanyl-tRNA synthetase alpha chain
VDDLLSLRDTFLAEIEPVASVTDLQQIRTKYTGKKGLLTARLKALSSLTPEERRAAGKTLNEVKNFIEETLKAREVLLREGE